MTHIIKQLIKHSKWRNGRRFTTVNFSLKFLPNCSTSLCLHLGFSSPSRNKRINIEIEIIVFKHSSFYLPLQWAYHFLLHHRSVWHATWLCKYLLSCCFCHPQTHNNCLRKELRRFKCHSIFFFRNNIECSVCAMDTIE